jgi:hypothetical protein
VPYSTVVATIVEVVDTIHHSFRRWQGQKADKDIVSWLGGSPSIYGSIRLVIVLSASSDRGTKNTNTTLADEETTVE